MNASEFDFNSLKEAVGADPFAKQSNKFKKDERFYVLKKDKEGNGAALIRFLPDSEKRMIIQLQKINSTIIKNGKKRFVSEFSPASIGKPCPFQQKWQKHWNAGDKEKAKQFGRSIRYITNIKVLKDPANPENEGKIFLYEMSGAINSKLEKALKPSETDIALGKTPKQLFNPVKGNSFRLVAQKGSNGLTNYDASEVVNEETSIYNSVEEAVKDIKENTYKLSDLLKPEAFLSYDELVAKLKYVTFEDQNVDNSAEEAPKAQEAPTAPKAPKASEAQTASEAPKAQEAQTASEAPTPAAANTDLDSILKDLV